MPTAPRCAGRTTCRPSRRARRSRARRRRGGGAARRAPRRRRRGRPPRGGGDDPGEVGDRADGVGGVGDRDPARALRQHGLDGARRQLERLALRLGEAHGRARALGVDHPRADVGVVVEARADDLVAWRERAPDGAGEGHRQRGHAEAEDDLARGRAEQRAGARARRRDELVGRVRRRERAAVVGAAARAHPRVHRLDRGVDHLRARRPVEPRPARGREPGEALAVQAICSAAESTSSLSWG